MDYWTKFQLLGRQRQLFVMCLTAAGILVFLDILIFWSKPAAAELLITLVPLIVVALLWLSIDRLLISDLHDHRNLPARPEYYDFEDLNQPMHWDEIAGKNLKALTFVVFDTETTGLRPSHGDEIISIAAIRISDGRIDEAAPFSRLVNPGMPIPPQSIRFHNITDPMVAAEASLGEVLPAFREFVGDAILVAHNAAFDLKFLRMKEISTGVRFENLVLDTLLCSVFLDHDSHDHSLDNIAQRIGLTIEGRHTALGDSIASARIFLKMLDRLEARGITTLRQAVEALAQVEKVKKLSEKF